MSDPSGRHDSASGGAGRITFPDGILGFADCKEYDLAPVATGSPIHWLQSHDEPGRGFALAPPGLFCRGRYEVPLSAEDRRVLGLEEEDETDVFVIVNVSADGPSITGNLKGPIVINRRSRLAKQVVIYNPSLSLRAPLLGSPGDLAVPARGRA